MGGCGKAQDEARPEEEYARYVWDLKKEVKTIEETIAEHEERKEQLEDEIAEIEPQEDDGGDDSLVVDFAFGAAKVATAVPIQRTTAIVAATGAKQASETLEAGLDHGWDYAEQKTKRILNPVINLIAQLSDLIYFGFGAIFAFATTYMLTDDTLSHFAYGPITSTTYTIGVLMMVTGAFGIVALIRGNMGLTHYQILKRRRWKQRKKKYRRWQNNTNRAEKAYREDLAKWKTDQPKDAEGNLLPEPVMKEFKEPQEPGEEYIRPKWMEATTTTKEGWARGDKDVAQDLVDRNELAQIRTDVLLWLKGVFVLKFVLFLMMLFVVTITFMLLFDVDDPIGSATDASWGPSVDRENYDSEARYLQVVDIQVGEDVLAPQKDFRIRFFETEDTDKRGIGLESCQDGPQCSIFLEDYPDNLTPDPQRSDTHVLTASGESVARFTEFAVEPQLRKSDKARQFRDCDVLNDLFLATLWENAEWEEVYERYDDDACTHLIETLGRIDGIETCQVTRAADGDIPAVEGTLNKAGDPCQETEDHACLFRIDEMDAVLSQASIETEVRDLCQDTCYRMGIHPGPMYLDPNARSAQQARRDRAFASCHACVDECKEAMNEGLRDVVRPAAVGVWITFFFTTVVWMWNNAATDQRQPPDPENPRAHWTRFDWFMKGTCVALNSIVGCIAVAMIYFVYSMKTDLDESCPTGDCASHFVAYGVVLLGITLFCMGWTCAYVVVFQRHKFLLKTVQLVYLIILLCLLEFATLMSITTGDIPSLNVGEVRQRALYVMTHPDVCQEFDMTDVCTAERNIDHIQNCMAAPTSDDLRATALLDTDGNPYDDENPAGTPDEDTSPWFGTPEGGCQMSSSSASDAQCEATCQCLNLGNGSGIVTEEMQASLESCKEFMHIKYQMAVEYFSYFLLTVIWYCLYTLYFNQKATAMVEKSDKRENDEIELERTKQFVQARVRVRQAQKLNVLGEEALYWALKCQKAGEVGKVRCGNYKRDLGEAEEAPPPEKFQLPRLPTWLVGKKEVVEEEESYETWPDWPLSVGAVKETMEETMPLREGGFKARLEAHSNFSRMTTKKEQQTGVFQLDTSPDFGPNNSGFYKKQNAGFIDNLMKDNRDNPNVPTNTDRESYYVHLEQLSYMVDENSPSAHQDLVTTCTPILDKNIEIKVTKKGKDGTIKQEDVDMTTMKEDKKGRLRRIKMYKYNLTETWVGMPLDKDTAQYMRDAAIWCFWEAKRRLESPSVRLQTHKIPKYYKHEELGDHDDNPDTPNKRGFFRPGPLGSSKKNNEQEFVAAEWRRLDPRRFKNEIADDIETVPRFFGLCSTTEIPEVVPGVGESAMAEWDIVCRGLDTIRKEEIRIQRDELARNEELLRQQQEEARLAAEEADRAHELEAAAEEKLEHEEEEFAKMQDEEEIQDLEEAEEEMHVPVIKKKKKKKKKKNKNKKQKSSDQEFDESRTTFENPL